MESIWEKMPPVAPYQPGLVPARSKKDLPLAKAGPIHKGYSASGIMSLRVHARNSPGEARAGKKEERRCSRQRSRRSSAETEENNGLVGFHPPFCATGNQMCPCRPEAILDAGNALTPARNKMLTLPINLLGERIGVVNIGNIVV